MQYGVEVQSQKRFKLWEKILFKNNIFVVTRVKLSTQLISKKEVALANSYN